jgi:hypothetical protein
MESLLKPEEKERHGFILIVSTILQLRQIFDSKTYYSSARRNWIRGDYLCFCKKNQGRSLELLGYGIIGKLQFWIEKDNWKLPYGRRHRYSDCIILKYVNILDSPLILDYLLEKLQIQRFKQALILSEEVLDDVLEKID